MPDIEAPPAPGAQEPTGIQAALAAARETLADRGSLFSPEVEDTDDVDGTPPDDDGGEEAPADEGEEEAEEEDEELEEDPGDGLEDEEGEDEGEGEAEEEEVEAALFTATIPGRGPDDDDIEIEVTDQATADALNRLKNGYMRGDQFRDAMAEVTGAQEELYEIEEQFGVDPAGFVLQHLDEKHLATVALALVVEPKAWASLQKTLTRLIDNPQELRTLQAEAKSARLETKEALKEARTTRTRQNENAAALQGAIDRMVPEDMGESKRDRLIRDMTRDVVEHINRNKIEAMEPKDLVTVLADRLELNGIDPLEARSAVKDGSRTRSTPTTKKKKVGKPKSGKQLARASAKRRRVAAAPGAGKKAPPTQPKTLPAGQTIQERLKEVRKRGLGSILGR